MKTALFTIGLIAILGLLPFTGSSGEPRQEVAALKFSPDGQHLAAGVLHWHEAPVRWSSGVCRSHACDVCRSVAFIDIEADLASPIVTQELAHGDRGQVCWQSAPDIQFIDGSRSLAILPERSRKIEIWNVSDRQQARVEIDRTRYIQQFSYSPDGRWLAVAGGAGLQAFDIATSREVLYVQVDMSFRDRICLEFTPDSRLLLTSTPEGGLIAWDTHSWQAAREFPKLPNAHVRAVAVARDSRQAAVATQTSFHRWDLETGELQTLSCAPVMLAGGRDEQHRVAISADGGTVAAGGQYTVLVFNGPGEAGGRFIPAPSVSFSSLALSPDGGRLAIGDSRGEVTIWDCATQSRLGSVLIPKTFLLPPWLAGSLFFNWCLSLWIVHRKGLFTSPEAKRATAAAPSRSL